MSINLKKNYTISEKNAWFVYYTVYVNSLKYTRKYEKVHLSAEMTESFVCRKSRQKK